MAKAAGLNHWAIDCCAGIGATPLTGFARLLAPVLDGDPGTVTVNGRPDCTTSTSPICQSLKTWETTLLLFAKERFGPKGNWYVAATFTRWRMSLFEVAQSARRFVGSCGTGPGTPPSLSALSSP